jgi:hypothetical protein
VTRHFLAGADRAYRACMIRRNMPGRRDLLGSPEAGESEEAWMARCERDGGDEKTCAQMWIDSHPVPMKGIPLRPDFAAARERGMDSIARAALAAGRAVADPSAHRALASDRQAQLVLRSPTTPLTTTDAAALQAVKLAFLASLVPISAGAAVLAKSIGLSFDGAGSIGIPALTLPSAGWLGESHSVAVVAGTTSRAATLWPYKIAVAFSVTNELMRNTNAVDLMRQVLLENTAPVLDASLFSAGAEVLGTHPAGLLAGIAPLTATAGGGSVAMLADLKALAAAVAPAAGNAEPILVCAPAQAIAVKMSPRDPMPIFTSSALAAGVVVCVVPPAIASVVEAPRIDVSAESVMHLDSAPSDNIGIPGTPNVVAARSYSVFQTDSVALRLIMNATWALRSASAVAWISNCTW